MNWHAIFPCLLMTSAIAANAQGAATAARRPMPPATQDVQRASLAQKRFASPAEAVDPQVLRRLNYRVSDTPARTAIVSEHAQPAPSRTSTRAAAAATPGPTSAAGAIDTTRTAAAEPTLTVDLKALRTRIGSLKDTQVFHFNSPATNTSPDAKTVSLAPGDILVAQRNQPATTALLANGVTVTSSPTVLYTLDNSRPGSALRELGLVHRSAGLYYRPDRAQFAGELLVGIVDREDPRASGQLEKAIPMQLLAAPGALGRTRLDVDHIGLPFEVVAVELEGPEDPFKVELVSQMDPDLPAAELRVHRPQLSLTAPAALEGLGVGEDTVTVSAIGPRLRTGQPITLDLDNGWLGQKTIVVGDNGTASTRIRSMGLGSGTLRLAAGTYTATPKTIAYTAPWLFLVATLLGGMLGAMVFVYRLRRKVSRSRRRYTLDWVVGVIIGFGATTMAYAGMRLPEWIPVPQALFGEVVPFALSFICAVAGMALIDAMSRTAPD